MSKNILIQKNILLNKYTSFKIGGPAKFFIEITKDNQIPHILNFAKEKNLPILLIGEGSNMLISDKGFSGIVLHINTKGVTILKDTQAYTILEIKAGEKWDDIVKMIVEKNLWGIENMSHIPGKTGSIVIQNVGAYGQEAKDFITEVKTYDIKKNTIRIFNNKECQFNYRSSIFNTTQKNRFIILSITIKLQKKYSPNLKYQDLQQFFISQNITNPTIGQIRKAIIDIRESKIPHPPKLGSAGSFFKNTTLSPKEFKKLEEKIIKNFSPKIHDKLIELKNKFKQNSQIKIPTAFLIDICGLKGTEIGGARVHDKHALAIVNSEGKATADDVLSLMKKIRNTVYKKTRIIITPEVQLIGFSQEELNNYFQIYE